MHEEERPEIFIGLIGAIGIDLGGVGDRIAERLRRARYRTDRIRVSDCLMDLRGLDKEKIRSLPIDERIHLLQDHGDLLCLQAEHAGAAMWPALAEIRRLREIATDGGNGRAYVIHSLKRPDEVALLRGIYGTQFIAIGCVESSRKRKEYLIRQFNEQAGQIGGSEDIGRRADQLIARDDADEENEHGQNVRDTLALADVFISMGGADGRDLGQQIERICDALLGSPWLTPSVSEYAMAIAGTAAARSLDLSRQVGAAIVDKDGAIIATGFNEVPVPGGGTDWTALLPDDEGRDIIARDANAYMRRTIFTEFVQSMHDADLLKDGLDVKKTVDDMLEGDFRKIFKRRRVSNLIEFGRIVHAEMAALTDAARRGHAVAGATVYCTTYPCHMCARHLIAAGISRVIYIEPYPKSLTRLLYAKSVVHDDDPPATAKALYFQPFIGITPRLYDRVFELGSRLRKDRAGRVLRWREADAVPLVDNRNSNAYLKHEAFLATCLGTVLQRHQERQEGEP